MQRQARERIIAIEVMKLERRQALERKRGAHEERPPSAQRPRDHRTSTRA
jgi:hypothetical protein